jgi:hypothetical protein
MATATIKEPTKPTLRYMPMGQFQDFIFRSGQTMATIGPEVTLTQIS